MLVKKPRNTPPTQDILGLLRNPKFHHRVYKNPHFRSFPINAYNSKNLIKGNTAWFQPKQLCTWPHHFQQLLPLFRSHFIRFSAEVQNGQDFSRKTGTRTGPFVSSVSWRLLIHPRLKLGASAAHIGSHHVPATPTPRTAVPDTEFYRDKWIRMEWTGTSYFIN